MKTLSLPFRHIFILGVCFLGFPEIVMAQQDFMRFSQMSTPEGLSNTNVEEIVQDHQGFIWIATSNGLNRYDGHQVTVYTHDPSNPRSLSSGNIICLFVDRKGRLWVGTRNGGLNLYLAEQDTFIRFTHAPEDSLSISGNYINAIVEDQKGNIWVGATNGLNRMNPDQKTFTRFYHDPEDQNSIPHNVIHAFQVDQSGRLWIGTHGGLCKFDPTHQQFINYQDQVDTVHNTDRKKVYSLCEDKNGGLWIGTGYGVNRFIPEKGTFKAYIQDQDSTINNRVYALSPDQQGNLWVSFWGIGISLFSLKDKSLSPILQRKFDPSSIQSIYTHSIYCDRSGLIWLGTLDQGLYIHKSNLAEFVYHKNIVGRESISKGPITGIDVNEKQEIWISNHNETVEKILPDGKIIHYTQFKKGSADISARSVFDVLEDRDHNVWIATGNSVFKLDQSSGIFYRETLTQEETSYFIAYTLFQDRKGIIWIGSNQGLFKYNPENDIYTQFKADPDDPNSLTNRYVYEIYEDQAGLLWVGTRDGLNYLERKSGKFSHFKNIPDQLNSISSNTIHVIYEDQSGNFWVGTDTGLNLFDRKKGTFKRYTTINGPSDNMIYAILEDTQHNLWMSTRKSILKWNPKTESGRSYHPKNGMPMQKFFRHAFFQDQKGNIFLGGNEGFIRFHPNRLLANQQAPIIALTNFKLFNQIVQPIKESLDNQSLILKKNINHTEAIHLSYKDYVFSFEFAALDFTAPRDNQYAYKMEGLDDAWLYTDANHRVAMYNRLSPGSYTFQVKGTNNDGVWSKEIKSIQVIIHPPWWKTTWAYAFYVLLFLGSLYGFIQWRASRLEKEKRVLKQLVQEKTLDLLDKNEQLEQQAHKLIELDETKTRFFANISHEFRTPLTVILGLIQKQISSAKDQIQKQNHKIIQRNAERLLQLINQLLDLSKLESGQVQLNTTTFDIFQLTKKIILLLESTCMDKEISVFLNQQDLFNQSTDQEIIVKLDQEKIRKILNNLISNAVKFTPANGKIWISLSTDDQNIILEVTNTGTPIPQDSLPRLFDRFYQVDTTNTREYEGSGIGLALVKELTELHHGTIIAQSNHEKTTFICTIPTIILKNQLKHHHVSNITTLNSQLSTRDFHTSISTETVEENILNRLEILVVEDNDDLRSYITSILAQDYHVIQAINGKDGLEQAETHMPDLIVSDVMMPKMDGYEFCKAIKTNEKTNHIPVILLTAKASQENKLEGLETGADDYLIKPFDEIELKLRAKNLISIRSQLQEKYQQEIWLKPNEVKVSSVHQKFLEDIKAVLEAKLSDDTFTVEMLGKEVGLSRSQLHRKLKALTDQSATTFIRNYRLHRAADLLKNNVGTVTEIAYQVGFSSQTYFSSSFQKLFGCSPSEFIEKQV